MDKETKFYIFLAMVAAVVLLLVYADQLWVKLDENVIPYVISKEDQFEGSGSADSEGIRNIHIAWEKGNVTIVYANTNQARITWTETFTQGKPSQYCRHQYWMNTATIFINYYSQDYGALMPKSRHEISKDLVMFIPRGIVLDEIVVRCVGKISCNVEAKKMDTQCMSE